MGSRSALAILVLVGGCGGLVDDGGHQADDRKPAESAVVLVELNHEVKHEVGTTLFPGFTSLDATAIRTSGAPASTSVVVGRCILEEQTDAARTKPVDLDVGPIVITTPARSYELVADERYRGDAFVASPNEWRDGDRLFVSGAGSSSFPAFEGELRAANALNSIQPSVMVPTSLPRGRDFVVKWTSADPAQEALVVLFASDQVGSDRPHARSATCRGGGGELVIPASVVAHITETPWSATFRRWTIVAERRAVVQTTRGDVTIVSRSPSIRAALDAWTPIVIE